MKTTCTPDLVRCSATGGFTVWPLLLLLTSAITSKAATYGEFSYEVSGSVITITDYNCSDGPVVIPDSIDGMPVTSIGDRAFLACTNLTSVTLPDSVTSIGSSAFDFCTSLTGVVIPESVTTIGERAFYNCVNLTAIDVAPLNPAYSSLEGVLFNKNQSVLIQLPRWQDRCLHPPRQRHYDRRLGVRWLHQPDQRDPLRQRH